MTRSMGFIIYTHCCIGEALAVLIAYNTKITTVRSMDELATVIPTVRKSRIVQTNKQMRFLILALFLLTGCSRTSNPYWYYMSNTQDAYYLRYYAEQVICPSCADTCHTALDYDECVRKNLARMMLRLEVKHDKSNVVKTRGQMVDKNKNE